MKPLVRRNTNTSLPLDSAMQKLASLCLVALLLAPARGAENASDWTEEANKDGVTILSRKREGTSLKEFRGVGSIDAPTAVVFAVLDDTDAYSSFMPYTSESRVLKRAKDFMIAYQRLDLPMVSDRDYTLRSDHSKSNGPDGTTFRIHWTPANDLGPAEKTGVQRVNICEGGWVLEPGAKGTTRATYTIFTDSGGVIPAFVANNGSKIAIRKLFEAVRKQVHVPKYANHSAQ